MKFENRKTSLRITPEKEACFADLLLFLYNQGTMQQVTMAKMRQDLKIMDILEKNIEAEEIEFEDSMKESIKNIVESSSWAIRHKDLVAFGDYVESL